MRKATSKWQSLATLALCALAAWGCADAESRPSLETVEVPEDVNVLANDVIAFRFAGAEMAKQEIPFERLRAAIPQLGDLMLLEYGNGAVTEVPFERGKDSIVAAFDSERTYLVAARPFGRALDIDKTLCSLDLNRSFLDHLNPELWDRTCLVINCAPDLVSADELLARLPSEDRQAMAGAFEFGRLSVGGWGGGGDLCERCTGFRPGGIIVGDERCHDRVRPDPEPVCDSPLLTANFDADSLAAPPAALPAGLPADDSLDITGAPGNVVVVDSVRCRGQVGLCAENRAA